MSPERRRGFVSGLLAGVAATLAALALVSWIAGGLDDDRSLADEALDVIERSYFAPVDRESLEQSSVDGIVDELRRRYDDRFSHYFDPEALADFERATSGSFSGVGLTVNEVPRGLRVAGVLPGTPAERAGIEEGDLITAVDGRPIAGVPAQVSTARIKGPPGTQVTLRVVSVAGGRASEVSLRRANVRVPAVEGRLREADGADVAHVRFATFSVGAHGELRETVEDLYRDGASGLVLDLRGNGGGLLNEAVLTASLFVEDGRIASTESRAMGDDTYDAVGEALDPRPLVVLVNRDTASAAEILTGALSHHGLATIVGTRTYGKGTVQEVITLAAGGALDLTIGEYLPASGESLADRGIPPDVRAVDDPLTQRDEALERALAVLGAEIEARS